MLATKNMSLLNTPWTKFHGYVKAIKNLALGYVFVNDRKHRIFSLVTMMLFILVTLLFLAFATVEKLHLTQNFLYGQIRFSFIDWGYAEILGYSLTVIAAIIFFKFAALHNQDQWDIWAIICLIIFADDSMQFHERIGNALMNSGTVSSEVGELIGFAIMGSSIILLWLIGIWKSPKQGKQFLAYLLFSVYLALLICAGVGVDAVHGLIKAHYQVSETVMTLLEDGSELVMQAVIAISAYGMWRLEKGDSPYA